MKDINLFKAKDSIFLKKISSKSEININNTDECDGYLIESSENEARKIIDSLKMAKSKKIIAFVGGDNSLNRRAVETLKIDYLVSPEKGLKKDTLKQRDSGINHVVAKEAAKKGISFVINLCEISRLSGKEKSLRIEKIIQNIKICRKANCPIKIASFAENKNSEVSEHGRKAFGASLGMSSEQTKDTVNFKQYL